MKRYSMALAVVFSVWTYGSEPLDILMQRGEWETFSQSLQCEARAGSVWCAVDGKWYTIENKPLPVPWGVE
jgi:hypothetical protein